MSNRKLADGVLVRFTGMPSTDSNSSYQKIQRACKGTRFSDVFNNVYRVVGWQTVGSSYYDTGGGYVLAILSDDETEKLPNLSNIRVGSVVLTQIPETTAVALRRPGTGLLETRLASVNEKLANLSAEATLLKTQIRFMEDNGLEKFDAQQFKVFQVIQHIKGQAEVSDLELSQSIVDIMRA